LDPAAVVFRSARREIFRQPGAAADGAHRDRLEGFLDNRFTLYEKAGTPYRRRKGEVLATGIRPSRWGRY
jgi:hypothetical protein